MLKTFEQRSKLKLTATFITVIVIAGIVLIADHLKSQNKSSTTLASLTNPSSTTSTNSNTVSNSTPSTATSTSSSSYKDGTFTATSDYYVPHGEEAIQVSLTLSNGTITNASIENSESDNASARYQEGFAAEYKNYVIGKNISDLKLDVISGASDTTQGFNDAVSQIASEAKA